MQKNEIIEEWVEKFFETPAIAELNLAENINQFHYRFSRKQRIYGVNDDYQSTKQGYDNKVIEKYNNQDNNINIY